MDRAGGRRQQERATNRKMVHEIALSIHAQAARGFAQADFAAALAAS
jgi:hypothetical protein